MDKLQYHLEELKIALDRKHSAHILPDDVRTTDTILDIGCGVGQTLIALDHPKFSFGVDPDFEALRFGTTLTGEIRFTCGRAEALPFRDGQFDLIIARVSLHHTVLRDSFEEIRRVLRSGGRIWITLHPFRIPWQQARAGGKYPCVPGWTLCSHRPTRVSHCAFERVRSCFPGHS